MAAAAAFSQNNIYQRTDQQRAFRHQTPIFCMQPLRTPEKSDYKPLQVTFFQDALVKHPQLSKAVT